MGYQALLFCPDEKTARSVTQVLSELDFTVVPCTEPFGAVKKLMGEHFDAVVVDCDNEQNATLLLKSARNTPNQSSLAVAVVEGQAGVAKAFRIGANLVLTKPINVEQAKGTLRVARGLLRKSEAGKPAAAAPAPGAAVKPAKPVPPLPKPAPQARAPQAPNTQNPNTQAANTGAANTRVVAARPAAPVKPLVKTATASIPTQKPPQPRVVAAVPSGTNEIDSDVLEVGDEIASPSMAAPEAKITASQPAIPSQASPTAVSAASSAGSGAASAPAPAREPISAVIAEPESSTGKIAELDTHAPPSDGGSAPASSFTFGGNVSEDAKSGGGSKKVLLIVAAVVLIAAAGYALWMQWIRSSGAATPFTHVAVPQVKAPAVVPQAAPSAAPVSDSSATPSATSSVPSSSPDSAPASPSSVAAKPASDSDTSPAENTEAAPVHPSKATTKADTAKPAPAPTPNKPAAKVAAPAIVMKNNLSQPAAKPASSPDAPAPSLTGIAPADNGGSLSNLMGGQSTAPAPVLETLNVSQGISQGMLVKRPQPIYPARALQMRVEGVVELMATVSKTGDISAVKILSGDPGLARSAVDAVKQWKYKPYLLNGDPVEIQTQITLNFKLPK
jgi:periplasmic protein TonB